MTPAIKKRIYFTLLLLYCYVTWTFSFYTHFYKTEAIYLSFAPIPYKLLLMSCIIATLAITIGMIYFSSVKDRLNTIIFSIIAIGISYWLSYQSMNIGYSIFTLSFYKYGPLLILVPLLINIGLATWITIHSTIKTIDIRFVVSFMMIPLIILMIIYKIIFMGQSLFDINWIVIKPYDLKIILPSIVMAFIILIMPWLIETIIGAIVFKHPRRLLYTITFLSMIALILTLLSLYGAILFPEPPIINAPTI